MSNIPPRPKADKVMILAACTLVAEKINGDAETIAKHYRRHMDGFELAKELDKYASWDTTRDDMDALDEVDYLVDRAEGLAVKAWAEEFKPEPPLPIGTRVKQGVITRIYEHTPATYCVKEDGCTNDTRSLLIKFEDAVAVRLHAGHP
ncbi:MULTISPECIES: hypothetical protein [Pseudomonas]|uniref:Uncharacterized protein n=1 Tax=Pseudomonas fluorescens TaxID=294 RepID=A0A120G5K2_PSEFL|nr:MULTISPECIES: hypothetical protein [Pseudomonas]KRC97731.1 hypothetical protein ASE33_04120 [Pseudomonas sp. Root9]KWV84189.1 hypothetical protein PFL603g_00287 [Pseudomonas fluorescens]MBX4136339.1 DUF616 domain-containing protein [Pseudomonas sp. S5F11]SFW53719.1 hypothetical protein SAMN03159376_02051 [Pseudomonas sp. NFACC09-4]